MILEIRVHFLLGLIDREQMLQIWAEDEKTANSNSCWYFTPREPDSWPWCCCNWCWMWWCLSLGKGGVAEWVDAALLECCDWEDCEDPVEANVTADPEYCWCDDVGTTIKCAAWPAATGCCCVATARYGFVTDTGFGISSKLLLFAVVLPLLERNSK